MARNVELFIKTTLAELSANHPDRAFLEGMAQAIEAYVEHMPAEVIADEWQPEGEPAAELGTTEDILTVLYTGPETVVAGESTKSSPAEAAAVAEVVEAVAPERQPRVTKQGRAVRKPDFQTTARGVRFGHFPLATHPDGEQTEYYDVFAFNKPGKPWADRLEALQLAKGQAVEVIGYERPSPGVWRNGNPKPKQIYVAAQVKAR